MRVMISQPLGGFDEEERLQEREAVSAMLRAWGHEIWGELSERTAIPKGVSQELWRLGRRLQDMAGADAVYFMDGWEQDRRCRLEYEACRLYYKIPMNNAGFDIIGLFEFVNRYYPEALELDWHHAKCQICGEQGAKFYRTQVVVNIQGLPEFRFNERIIFLCKAHKDLAKDRYVNHIEPDMFGDIFKSLARPWDKMPKNHHQILYYLAKNIVDGYECKFGKLI